MLHYLLFRYMCVVGVHMCMCVYKCSGTSVSLDRHTSGHVCGPSSILHLSSVSRTAARSLTPPRVHAFLALGVPVSTSRVSQVPVIHPTHSDMTVGRLTATPHTCPASPLVREPPSQLQVVSYCKRPKEKTLWGTF